MKLQRLILSCCLAAVFTACVRQPDLPVEHQREINAQNDFAVLFPDDQISCQELTLADVIEIALSRNLDLKVKAFEYEVQYETSTGECLKMLPNLIANAETYYRNRNTGSFSESLDPNRPPAPPSISSEQRAGRSDISLIWNLLDFGLSYFRARQERNKAYILQLEYERLRQNLIVDVTRQYWRAIAARKARDENSRLKVKAESQITIYDQLIEKRILPKILALRGQNQLINMQIELQTYDREYHTAMSALASAMGLHPCTQFELIEEESLQPPPRIYPSCYLDELALLNRPELYVGDTQVRIMADEIKIAILQMLPGVEFYGTSYYDSNRFLIYNYWQQIGLRASWNLLAWPRHISDSKTALYRKDLARENRLAVSLGVLTQLHLALLTYADTLETYELYAHLRDVNRQLLATARKETRYGKMHEADLIKYETESAISEVDALKAYGELQVAIEQINNALGIPFYFNRYGLNVPVPSYDEPAISLSPQNPSSPLYNTSALLNGSSNLTPPPPRFYPNRYREQRWESSFQQEGWMRQSMGEGRGSAYDAGPRGSQDTLYWMVQPGYEQRENRDWSLPIRTPSNTNMHQDEQYDWMTSPGFGNSGSSGRFNSYDER